MASYNDMNEVNRNGGWRNPRVMRFVCKNAESHGKILSEIHRAQKEHEKRMNARTRRLSVRGK